MNAVDLIGWDRLRHGGLLLDTPRLRRIADTAPGPLNAFYERELRRLAARVLDESAGVSDFVVFVLERVCGFTSAGGFWQRGSQVGAEWGRRAVTGEIVKPRHLWRGVQGALLPVFFDSEDRLGMGRGRKAASQTVQWLRAGNEKLALLTNGRQWRLIFAGLDFDAWCEWDVDLWFEEGALSPQVDILRTLISPALWTPAAKDSPLPLLEAILDSRKGQAELSAVLGERVREAVELLVQGHGDALKERCVGIDPGDIYRAAVRVVMRMVVVLFAESRELLPRENALYHGAYGLSGLLEELEKVAARGGNRLARSWNAWPRILALFRLVHQGSHHPALPVPAYGGELFAPGDPAAADGLIRALAVFESAAFDNEILPDLDVHRMLDHITRTRVKVRQGRASTWVPAPVDFSDLSSEYIGILYEGLLDFELKTAPAGDPVVFLAVGNQPALPLSRLEAMDDNALANLLEKMKDTSKGEGEEEQIEEPEPAESGGAEVCEESAEEETSTGEDESVEDTTADSADERHTTRTRAETWARRAVEVGKLARKPKGAMGPEKRLAYEDAVSRKARQLVIRVILPGEWYLVRWGGTRKGAGTFYTRPGLAVPTVQRTLRPLAHKPPLGADGAPDLDAPHTSWTPKTPEQILALKVCDVACGSGTFPVATLRFLTEALFASLHYHGRVSADGDRAVVRLLDGGPAHGVSPEEHLGQELLPCRPDDPLFEPRLKAILRRHIVERCIYGVDFDPLAVELCRLSLWIETMDRTLPFSFLDHKIKCGNALVGAWFDQFQHYPVMAWKNREGGDKGHSNGVHFQKEARGQALKAFVKERLTPDLRTFLSGRTLFSEDLQGTAGMVHAEALATLSRLHDLPVQDSAERTRIYREELIGSAAYRSLKAAMNLWCACWFWPADELNHAPLPTTLAAPPEETRAMAERIATRKRFFHWELEFPDVFRTAGSGFDAILGNPPWETLQPNSSEFFSNIDPLFRSYGKQEALRYQTDYFADAEVERAWIEYSAGFACDSNWMKYAAASFGDPEGAETNADRFTIARGNENATLHARWRAERRKSCGYASPEHPFRHRGEGKAYTYKLFLEQAHALLRGGGRFGLIVPSGLYSDHGTTGLRSLFLDRCRWEWLFNFINWNKIFPSIYYRLKFNAVVVQKGGTTIAIKTAFVRTRLEDWERAEALATPYTLAQVARFSPRSKAILEIQSQRDLDILEKIYSNSVLLGDDSPDGWGIKYAQGDFNMTSDSKLFPPRPKWEAEGYRPDEYSRWVKGDWRPIADLWDELGVKPPPAGDLRCAQPPYNTLPIPRVEIPTGIVLSRAADAWMREARVEDVALPLYEGRMIGQFDFSQKGWVTGKGRGAVWEKLPDGLIEIRPQYLMSAEDYFGHLRQCLEVLEKTASIRLPDLLEIARGTSFIDVTSSTNARTTIAAVVPAMPHGHSAPKLLNADPVRLAGILNSLAFDWCARLKQSGLHLVWAVLEELPVAPKSNPCLSAVFISVARLSISLPYGSIEALLSTHCVSPGFPRYAATTRERVRLQIMVDAVMGAMFGLDIADMCWILRACDHSPVAIRRLMKESFDPNGFWRVDKDKDPELRHTVLTLVAFHDLEEKIRACGGDRKRGIEAFLSQNDGEGWMLPETLRLADYGLGHDERAKEHQPVGSRFGPRFYDWQLAQSAEESWRECHLHARNLLGESGYRQLLAEKTADGGREKTTPKEPSEFGGSSGQGSLFS
jgi:hypothetical protein